jgi:hypothetical protein
MLRACRSFQIPVTIEIGERKKVVGVVDRALMMTIESAGTGKRQEIVDYRRRCGTWEDRGRQEVGALSGTSGIWVLLPSLGHRNSLKQPAALAFIVYNSTFLLSQMGVYS